MGRRSKRRGWQQRLDLDMDGDFDLDDALERLRWSSRPGPVRGALVAAAAGISAAGWAASRRRRRLRGEADGQLDGAHTLRAEVTLPPVRDPAFLRTFASIAGAEVHAPSTVRVLRNGDQIFPAMLEAIREARRTVDLATYVWWRGDIAAEVADAIADRAADGVACNVLLDAVGAAPIDPELVERMREAGARVEFFRPPDEQPASANHRTHRKLLVVDGSIGFTGGVGIAEEWTGNAEDPGHWRDTHLRVDGPAVRGLLDAFAEHWLEATRELPRALASPSPQPRDGGVRACVVRSSAGPGPTSCRAALLGALRAARVQAHLTTAYLAPDESLMRELEAAAGRGVRVRLLVPGPHHDKRIVQAAGRDCYDRLLEAGIAIHEYQPTMLHAKVLTVDGAFATVGSMNLDARSFTHNDEANLAWVDETLTGILDAQFAEDLAHAEQVTAGGGRPGVLRRSARAVAGLGRRQM